MGSTKKSDHEKKSSWASVQYTYINELMLCLHWGKSTNLKGVKIPRSAALQVAKYMRTVK